MVSVADVFRVFGTDKESDVHTYGHFYQKVFDEFYEKGMSIKTIVEIGIDRGRSLCAWNFLFPNALIIGVDREKRFTDRQIPAGVLTLIEEAPRLSVLRAVLADDDRTADVIIDDASHTISDQLATLAVMWECLSPGGIYIVEDIQNRQDADLFDGMFGKTQVVDMREYNGRYDNVIVAIRKE